MRLLLLVTLPLYLLDQATKWLVLRHLALHETIPVTGFFNLVHVTNTGAAFGMMAGAYWFHVLFALAMAVFAAWMLFRSPPNSLNAWACVLLLTGIAGNLTDRFLHGHVIDFLDFHAFGWHWPAFNVADSCICIAVGLFLIASFREEAPALAGAPREGDQTR